MSNELMVTGCRVSLNQSKRERLKGGERLKGFATIIFNNVFVVCDLKIIQGKKGLFIQMPTRRRRDGSFHDVAHPIVPSVRDHIETVVLKEYDRIRMTRKPAESGQPASAH
ncbi:MAG: SpoVG family protein [bacterium]|nr:SpoVG family protein [bacterium]